MIAEELINQMIPPLKPSDSVRKATQWMEELRVHQLPVIENEQYCGLVSEEAIFQINEENAFVRDLELVGSNVYVFYHQHFYEILRLAALHNLQVIAVIGEEGNFLGVVTVNDTINAFAEFSFMQESGGILVLLVNLRDYSLTEISRLVESNNARILSTHINYDRDDPSKMRITLKIDKNDLNRITATFERFNYQVIAKFHASENPEMDKERLDLLFRYLDI
ncbi:MAG: CBS domain-containing protein [Microscillaceae bacterium]|nr:CBS domain-containing protein [Microscillaceae bacterium]